MFTPVSYTHLQVSAAVIRGLCAQLHDERLLEGAARLHAVLEIHVQFEAIGGEGDVAHAQHCLLYTSRCV